MTVRFGDGAVVVYLSSPGVLVFTVAAARLSVRTLPGVHSAGTDEAAVADLWWNRHMLRP